MISIGQGFPASGFLRNTLSTWKCQSPIQHCLALPRRQMIVDNATANRLITYKLKMQTAVYFHFWARKVN
jgi:hypothetical protein